MSVEDTTIDQSDGSTIIREALMDKLRETIDPESGCFSEHQVDELMRQFHRAPGDEKEKLKEKDEVFVFALGVFLDFICKQGYMPKNTVLAFRMIAALLLVVEGILWELKGLPGDPPGLQQADPY